MGDEQIAGRQRSYTFIAADFAPMPGGTATFMYQLIDALPSSQVRVIATPAAESATFDREQRFAIQRVPVPPGWDASANQLKRLAPSFLRLLRQRPEPDMVLCCHGRLWLLLVARIYQQMTATPYGVFLHGSDILDARSRRSAPLYNRLLRGAHAVLANSRITWDAATQSGIDSDRMAMLHPCLNVARLTHSPEESRVAVAPAGKRIVLSVARLVPSKGIDLVIKALPAILASVPDVHYLIVGDGPERKTLETLASALGVAQHVTFAGHQPHHRMGDFYRAAEVFVLTPRLLASGAAESFGVTFLEANVLGLPVVASRVGGIADAVIDGETGLMVDPEHPAEIVAAVVRLLQDRACAVQLAENGRARVLREFTCQATAAKFVDIIEQTLQKASL